MNATHSFRVALVSVLFAIGLSAQSDPLLSIEGSVFLNGGRVFRVTPLFTGDHISTAPNGSATIHDEGSEVVVSSGSTIGYTSQQVRLGCGSVMIATSNRSVSVSDGDFTVQPATDFAEFEVEHYGTKLKVTPRAGAVGVKGSIAPISLEADKPASFATTRRCPDAAGESRSHGAGRRTRGPTTPVRKPSLPNASPRPAQSPRP
jgi:hypothetical protein